MRKYIFTLVFLFCSISILYPQKNDYVLGVVLNDITNEPIPFATILWKGEHLGCVSNEDGSFKLPFEDNKSEKILLIRSMGYETIEIPSTLIVLNKLKTFTLHEKVYSFIEFIVKGERIKSPSAKLIVSKAVKNISNNYPTKPFLIEGYYRDYLKKNNQYLNLYESLIELEDQGFLKKDYETSKIKQIYGRINSNFLFDSTIVLDYSRKKLKRVPSAKMGFKGGNELSILRLNDPIRNYERNNFDFINNLKTDFLNNHDFNIKEITIEDDKPIYVIQFNYNNKNITKKGEWNIVGIKPDDYPDIKVDGFIYIQKDNYSVKKLIYTLYVDDIKYGTIKGWELNMEYKDFNNKTYLNYLSYNNVFEVPNYSDSVYFYLKTIHIDQGHKTMMLQFNNDIEPLSENSLDGLKIKYHNENIDFTNIRIDERKKNMLIISFDDEVFRYYFSYFEPYMVTSLNIKLPRKLTDKFENIINKYETVLYYQYRELFVNKINLDYSPLKPEECIDKWRSLINYGNIEVNDSKEVFFNSPQLYKSEELVPIK